MDVRRTKLRLALGIILAGWIVAAIWHGYEGLVLHRGYPYDTFLFRPGARFSDFTHSVRFLSVGAPYRLSGGQNNHLPADYVIFRIFSGLPGPRGAIVFDTLVAAGLFVLLLAAWRPLFPPLRARALVAVPFLLSYPCLYGFDRANTEIVLALFIGLGLYLYSRRRFGLSFAALLLPICFKLYPVVLMLLFVRRRLLRWAVLLPFAFAAVTLLALELFIDPPRESLHWLGRQLHDYNTRFNLGQDGLGATASAWNLVRYGIFAVRALLGRLEWPVPLTLLVPAERWYEVALALLGVFLAWQVLLVERSWARRAILLLIYLTVSVPGGGTYKLMHVVTALVILILIPQARRFDLAATATLAFAIVPKQEIIFPWFGPTDSLTPDVPIAVFLNPLAQLLALSLLVAGARTSALPPLRRRLRKFAAIFRLPRAARGIRP